MVNTLRFQFLLLFLMWAHSANGASVVLISDLDDTVKQSHAWSRSASLKAHTHPDGNGPRPFPWLIKIYQALNPQEANTLYLTNSPLAIRYAWILSYLGIRKFNNFNLNIPQWLMLHKLPPGKIIQPWLPKGKRHAAAFKKKQLKAYLLGRPEFSRTTEKTMTDFYLFGDNGESDHIVYQETIEELKNFRVNILAFVRRVRFQPDEATYTHIGFFSSEKELLSLPGWEHFPDQELKKKIFSLSRQEMIPDYIRKNISDTTPGSAFQTELK